ncbi:MAG: hypothetical protein ACH0QD_13330 [Tepidibacillus sp.]
MILSPPFFPLLPKKPIITHNDLDGILSFLFLKEKGFNLVGFYDLETFYLTKEISPHQVLAVDLDISHPLIASIGHHYTLFSSKNHWNMNHLFGVTSPLVFKEEKHFCNMPHFSSKTPVSTFLFLHYITNTPLPIPLFKRAMLLYADGLHQSFKSYPKNVTKWLTALGYTDLLEDLETERLVPYFQEIVEFVSQYGFKATKKKPYPQCKFNPKDTENLLPFLEELAYRLDYKPIFTLPEVTPRLKGYRYSFYMDQETYKALKEKFNAWELLSHGVVFRNHIEVTLLTPLQEEKDSTLITRLKHSPWSSFEILKSA